MKFKKILAPTDFSKSSGEGLQIARDLAIVSEGEVFVLFIEEPVWNQSMPQKVKDILSDYDHVLHEHAQKRLEEVIKNELTGVKAYFAIGQGHPVEAILNTAKKEKIDLICMSTKGWDNLNPAESITERVVRNASIPVLVVPDLNPQEDTINLPMGVEE